MSFQEVRCPMVSASIFLSLLTACSVQGPYPPMYEVWLSCLGRLNSQLYWTGRSLKLFRLINSLPLTDCLDSLNHRRNVASLSIFYSYFHADCSSELANCMPPLLPRPRCTKLSTSSHPYPVHLPKARVKAGAHRERSYATHAMRVASYIPHP